MTDKEKLKEECYEIIVEYSPVSKRKISLLTYDGEQVTCRECRKTTDEYLEHESLVNEILLQLLDANRVYQNSEWEYISKDD